ncbi:zinc finger protein 431-like [Sabethes cyaneus]|uniref:zinc finger protein 431-like n=1 Tax=Sabethes cyaneus TaxID=53552 RepID=UPI00237D669A|nr:zinc finger protein 431-like [Sabethes cyaneus]
MSSDEDYQPEAATRKRGRFSKSKNEELPDLNVKEVKEEPDEDLDGIHYACSVCDQVFLHKSNFLRHNQRHDPPGGFICSICCKQFTSDWDRSKHKRDEHSVFRCRLCKSEFPLEGDYNNHILEEHGGVDREYEVCPTCGQQFRSASQLKVHMESNCGAEKKHECDVCQSRYLTQASLNAHMIKHFGEKSHLCNYCGASFLNKGQLKVHERMHTGEKPYKCNQCSKAFAHRESLITHSTTHSGIKPYYCSHCESRFSCIGNLLKHRRARPGSCGLPQYCVTNKIVARPNIKTMPNLTDRQVNNQKVVQRSGPPRARKFKTEEAEDKVISPKKRIVRKVPKPKIPFEQLSGDENESEEDSKSSMTVTKQSPIKTEKRSTKQNYAKLVNLKVEVEPSSRASDGDNPNMHTETIEVTEVKIEEDDFIIEEVNEGSIAEETIVHEEVLLISEANLAEFDGGKPSNETFENSPFSANDNDDSSDSGSSVKKPPVVVRKIFTEKPPVVTERKRRGRPKMILPPKKLPKDAIVIDLEQKKRELDELRVVFDQNVEKVGFEIYQCAHCPSQYCSEYLAGRHLERDHGFMLKPLLETLQYGRICVKERKYQCRYCERLYANEKALEKHIPLHGPDGSLNIKCPCCVTFYASREQALEHAYVAHPHRMECPFCDRKFNEPEAQASHVKSAHYGTKEPKKFSHVCQKCGKFFNARLAAHDHERSDCGRSPVYTCELCLKGFHSMSSLKNHYTVHTNELPYSCQYCGKNFRTGGQVKIHERVHTGEKPFVCTYCSKGFSHRESYHTHLSLHTGIKRYMCSGCAMRFTCVSNLQAHKKSHKTTCGTVPNASRVVADGYHELPEGYILPFPKNDVE